MSKSDAQNADIEYLSNILAKGITGLIAFGIADGIKLKQTLDRVTKSKQNTELWAQLLNKFCLMNPQAAAAIELAANMNPTLKALFERMGLVAKDATPDDEPDVKDAELC